MQTIVEEKKALERLLAGESVTFHFPGVLDPKLSELSGFIHRILESLDLGFLAEMLLVITKEIVANCAKANGKRLYAKQMNMNLSSKEDYEKLMNSFSREVIEKWDTFAEEHKQAEYYITIEFKLESDSLTLKVENNSEILPQEWARIDSRIQTFKKSKEIEKVFNEIKDDSEGAGLGIVLSMVLLTNAGIPGENFRIVSQGGKTIQLVTIPKQLLASNLKDNIKKELLARVDELPSFPDRINKLIQLCDSSSASLQQIGEEIQRDPALAAQILRIVHTVGYMNRNRDPSLTDAVKVIGLKVIRNLLLVYGARSVMSSRFRYKEMEQIWEAGNRASFIVRKIAKKGSGAYVETAIVAALLHELGKIILINLKPDLIHRIESLVGAGRIRNSSVLEEISLGISHPEIGASLARKWNFPEPLTIAIRYQQKPLQAPDEYRELIELVYMAVRLQEASQGIISIDSVEPSLLIEFGIDSKAQFETLTKSLAKEFKSSESGLK